ncbi:MAG: hypothetical protein HEP70_13920 [Rhodobiaceae bacterium]|nr:hypothetical protein [Rhodobiaceae bacterium]
MTYFAPNKIAAVLVALALTVAPAICCCFGFQDQAMAAPGASVSHMDMEDCLGRGSATDPASEHEGSSRDDGDCHDMGCSDCSVISAFGGAKDDQAISSPSFNLDHFAWVDDYNATIPNFTLLAAAANPLRGPPPFVRQTLVSLFALLLN